MSRRYVEIAIPVPLHQLFTYAVPEDTPVAPGCRARVMFGRRKTVGVVVNGPTDEPAGDVPVDKIRPVSAILDRTPVLPADLMKLAEWLAAYYHVPPGEAYPLPLPPGMGGGRSGEVRELSTLTETIARYLGEPQEGTRIGARMDEALAFLRNVEEATTSEVRDATGADLAVLKRLAAHELVELETVEVNRDPFGDVQVEPDTPPALTDEQSAAVERIAATLGSYHGFLLHGVTGSGKTEVYLRLIDRVLEAGRGALVLVPEIALTPQLVRRFRARLGERIAVQHSGLQPNARHEQWLRIAAGELPVVIGARSALFAPIPELGLVIVDEEHEPSFKQDVSPRYNARDLALVRGHICEAPVVLGSATPALETWANVSRGKLERVVLGARVHARPMPEIKLVDMRGRKGSEEEKLISPELRHAMESNLEAGNQTILFLNRRGFASFLMCRSCGHTMRCEHCSVSYTWHQRRQRLVCHYCDQTLRKPELCPECGDDALEEIGFGTERVVEVVKGFLPSARVERMDRDTTRGRALDRLLRRFRGREIDVLVGTQMVAKGHDFPDVTLVGVILAEQGLNFPDPRAAERTFQLLVQMAGRAGRAVKPGRVLVQTCDPSHPALVHAISHNYEAFAEGELATREALERPPSTWLALFRIEGPHKHEVTNIRVDVERLLTQEIAAQGRQSIVRVGPSSPAPIEKIKGRFRHRIMVRSSDRGSLRSVLSRTMRTLPTMKLPRTVSVSLDVDPFQFL